MRPAVLPPWLDAAVAPMPAPIPEPWHERHTTTGNWATEVESCAAFDALVRSTRLFVIHTEVRGQCLQPRLGQNMSGLRIDRILQPTRALVDAGWQFGNIGVECKRSGEKIGRPISQMIDYSRAVFELGCNRIALEWIFLWPMHDRLGGPVASIMAQQRLGCVQPDRENGFRFVSGGTTLAEFGSNRFNVTPRGAIPGSKAGSR